MRLSLVLSAVLFTTSLAAHADVVQNFNLAGTFDNGTAVSGTFTIDTTAGLFQAASISYLGGTYNVITAQAANAGQNAFIFYLSQIGGTYPELLFGLNGSPNLTGYAGGLICSEAHPCNGGLSAYALGSGNFSTYLASGAVTPGSLVTSVTPEPSSLALLGTGLLGAIGVVRRRLS